MLRDRAGSLREQLQAQLRAQPAERKAREARPRPRLANKEDPSFDVVRNVPPLEFFNGLGGFAGSGREYVTALKEREWTPAPWSNVIANPQFGFLVSADGVGSTYSINAQQNQLTPWSNDPVSNAPAEIVYIRDQDSGDLWSATPLPIREPGSSFVVSHGFGYSRFQHSSRGIALELLQFVPLADPIKVARLKIVNRADTVRTLSITYYLEWVLGNQRARTAPFVITEIDADTCALLARNPWHVDFPLRVAFMDMGGRQQSACADRGEFLGKYGSLAEPAGLLTPEPLSNVAGAGYDPCGALQTSVRLQPGEQTEIVLFLGQESGKDAASALLKRYRAADLDASFREVSEFWEQTLGAIQVKTPDPSMDVLLNGWLLYQTLGLPHVGAHRVLSVERRVGVSRSAAGRDGALRRAAIGRARAHSARGGAPVRGRRRAALVAAASPIKASRRACPTIGSGCRSSSHIISRSPRTSRCSMSPLPFSRAARSQPASWSSFGARRRRRPSRSYEHCALRARLEPRHRLARPAAVRHRRLERRHESSGRRRPGRERLARRGFLHATLVRFAPLAELRGDADKAALWRKHAFALQQAIEREAWDGDWYRRGYFDDGSPLGSVSSDECRIDSVAQSWAVISGGAPPARAARAMSAVNAQLVSRSEGLVELFTPPFDRSPHDPGYIKAYPPGLRENGGQYTHAAMWCDARVRPARRRRSGRRAVLTDEPGEPLEHARGDSPLQGRAVRGVCGRVFGTRSYRTRRLDLVYGIRGLDVPHGCRRHPRHQLAGRRPAHQSMHTAQLARIRGNLQARLVALSYRRGESARGVSRHHSRLARRARYFRLAVRHRPRGRRIVSLRPDHARLNVSA